MELSPLNLIALLQRRVLDCYWSSIEFFFFEFLDVPFKFIQLFLLTQPVVFLCVQAGGEERD